tara:strand:+ start:30616 stop:30969 length:354 start_codon:yes stop_codon:yes gene_type:complete
MQIIVWGVGASRGKQVLMWCGLWLSLCLIGRGVDLTVSGMRGCVSTRIKMKRFILKKRSETSGFCQVSLRLVSVLHLNQQSSRARHTTGVIAGGVGRSSANCVRTIFEIPVACAEFR